MERNKGNPPATAIKDCGRAPGNLVVFTIKCTLFLFCVGGAIYNIIEIIWRGYTHWSMFIVGGVCFNVIGFIHTVSKRCLFVRCALCSFAITAIEFFSGCLFNLRLKMNVWDYSALPFNFKGQVCFLYSVLWGLLSIIAIPVYKACIMHMATNKKTFSQKIKTNSRFLTGTIQSGNRYSAASVRGKYRARTAQADGKNRYFRVPEEFS